MHKTCPANTFVKDVGTYPSLKTIWKISYCFVASFKTAFASKSGSYSELRRGMLTPADTVQKQPFFVKDQVEV